ncbi:hypothetical protein MED193_12178 [Roseobacter sp. MED193]|nr:hypothetical protein MED193_12178 [Roseobacter sp. MED193]
MEKVGLLFKVGFLLWVEMKNAPEKPGRS